MLRLLSVFFLSLFVTLGTFGNVWAQGDGVGIDLDDDDDDDDYDGTSADDDDDDDDDDGVGVGNGGGDGTDGGSGNVTSSGGDYPVQYLARPRVLPVGTWQAGLDMTVISGPDGIDRRLYLGTALSGSYGVIENLSVSANLLLALATAANSFGGLTVQADYLVLEALRAYGGMGLVRPFVLSYSRFDTPLYIDDNTDFGMYAGADYRVPIIDKLAVEAGAEIVLQFDDADNLFALKVPISVFYQVLPNLVAGVGTGIYTGDDWSFAADEGFRMPLVLTGMYTLLGSSLDVGGWFGFASLVTDDVGIYQDIGDSLGAGLMARYRGGL